MKKLDAKAFGLAVGVMWGACLAIMTLVSLSIFPGYAQNFLNLIVDIYPGYTVTSAGILVGAVYGFIDGFLGGFILIWLYNQFTRK